MPWLLFMITVLNASFSILQSCDMPVLALVHLFCCAGVLFSYLSLWYIINCVPAAYGSNFKWCSCEITSKNMFSKHPVPFLNCCQKYCSVIFSIFQICLVLWVINQPVFVILMMYGCPLWSVFLVFAITSWIQGPPSSQCTATVDTIGEESEFLSILPFRYLSWCDFRAS